MATRERSMGVAYSLLGAILLLGGLGYLLDVALETAPWLFIGGIVASVVIGFVLLGRQMRIRV